jgi:hypothetical protein
MSNARWRRPGLWAAVAFTGAYLLAASIAAWASGNTEFVFYLVVMVILVGLLGVVHARIDVPTGLVWALAVWGALHMAGGLVPVPEHWPIGGDQAVVYSWWLIPHAGMHGANSTGWLKYDQLVHAYGFAITAWLCWVGLRAIAGPTLRPTFGALLIVVAASCGFGAMNEIVEFAATMISPSTNVGGYVNTGWDLVFNLAGAIIAAGVIRIVSRPATNA